jgi:hypothetical protein
MGFLRIGSVLVALGGLAALLAPACSAGSASGGTGGSGGDSAQATTTSTTSTSGLGGNFGSGGSGNCSAQCSSDLHTVLDCNGNVLKQCPADQGCAPDGSCVAACPSADKNKSNIGCGYYAFDPLSGGCFVTFVANTWGTPVKLSVELGGMPLDPSKFTYVTSGSGLSTTYQPLVGALPAGGVALVALSGQCPFGINSASAQQIQPNSRQSAFHITTDAPVVAYDIAPFGGGSGATTGATLLLPTSSWDTNYVGNALYTYAPYNMTNTWLAIVASEDNTSVTARLTAGSVGSVAQNLPATTAGQPATYTVAKGEVIVIGAGADLSGSILKADKPIGVWGGNELVDLPPMNTPPNSPMSLEGAADQMHQQAPPVRAMGSEYVAVRYRDRVDGNAETPPWRFIGAVDGTQLTFNPPVPGAPATLSEGQVVEVEAGGPFVVKSQDAAHPFLFMAHMTGCCSLPGGPNTMLPGGSTGCWGYGGPAGCAGDPESVNVIPPAQYLSSYVFSTDPTYPETDLVFVRTQAQDGKLKDVTLDCVGTLTGWQPVPGSPQYEYTRVDLVRHDFAKQGNCDNGRHEAKSDAPFGLTIWGWGSKDTRATFFSEAVSYAYPAGASLQPINNVVVNPVPK